MQILEIYMRTMKILEINLRIQKIMKILEIHMKITTKNLKIRIQYKKNEIQENHKNPNDNK